MRDMPNYTFILLEDGSLYVTAAKLTDKVHFDSGVRFGDKSLGEFLNEVFTEEGGKEALDYRFSKKPFNPEADE